MRFIRPIWEYLEVESPADALELPGETDYSGMSREELTSLMLALADAGDWDEVKKLQFWLNKETLVPEAAELHGVEGWSQIWESVKAGRAILDELIKKEQRRQRESIERAVGDLPEEEQAAERQRLLGEISDVYLKGDFITIQEWFRSQPKWVGAFTAFRFEQGASMEALNSIKDLMQRMRTSLGELEEPDHWMGIEPTAEDGRPGYERFGDALTELMTMARGRWVPKALPKQACTTDGHRSAGLGPVELRELWAAAPKEKQKEVLRLGAAINDLDKPNLIGAIRQKMSGIPSIDALIEMLRHQLTITNTDRGKLMEDALRSYPQVAVLYDGPDHAVFSFRTDTMLPTLCGKAKPWCIQPKWYNPGFAGQFWTYATGTLQLGIIDFTQEPSADYHTVGWTIHPDGRVRTAHDQQDAVLNISGRNWKEAMGSFRSDKNPIHSYPKELIDEVGYYFDSELAVKSQTDELYQKIGSFGSGESDREKAMLKMIEGVARNIGDLLKLANDAGDINSSENVAKQVIVSAISNFTASPAVVEALKDYTNKLKINGLVSPADVKIAETLLKKTDLWTEALITNIIARNNAVNVLIKKQLSLAREGLKGEAKFRLISDGIVDANTYLETIIQKIKSSEKS